jgi:hypothetical protein
VYFDEPVNENASHVGSDIGLLMDVWKDTILGLERKKTEIECGEVCTSRSRVITL